MNKVLIQTQVNAVQPSGRPEAVFKPLLSDSSKYAREEEYIARMIKRDREQGSSW